ncbi:hypothetical protein ACIRF8_12105 [Streptomyces sp. NPDC102406]|uniref:hypothetical protein n=1 Tax=Streptomyces sp. NPDC102406 TaxID=3366171 RepID=UPI00382C3738
MDAYVFLLRGTEQPRTPVSLVLPADIDPATDLDADALAFLLRSLFLDRRTPDVVSLKVGGATIGAVGRRRLLDLTDEWRAVAEGDGAQLPGASTQYTLLTYTCSTPECPTVEWHVIVPDRSPMCPNGHGPLAYGP